MTFKEAYESGRKFKRKAHSCWLIVSENGRIMESTGNYFKNIYGYSIVADDWEIESIKINLNVDDFRDALKSVASYNGGSIDNYINFVLDTLIEKDQK